LDPIQLRLLRIKHSTHFPRVVIRRHKSSATRPGPIEWKIPRTSDEDTPVGYKEEDCKACYDWKQKPLFKHREGWDSSGKESAKGSNYKGCHKDRHQRMNFPMADEVLIDSWDKGCWNTAKEAPRFPFRKRWEA
jgi:hypothetical protein